VALAGPEPGDYPTESGGMEISSKQARRKHEAILGGKAKKNFPTKFFFFFPNTAYIPQYYQYPA
jgi:hypothetical protein